MEVTGKLAFFFITVECFSYLFVFLVLLLWWFPPLLLYYHETLFLCVCIHLLLIRSVKHQILLTRVFFLLFWRIDMNIFL